MVEAKVRAPGSRRDAQRNRVLLVQAARDVFAEVGVEAPLDAIARRAGVGAGTLYRHFPTRTALVEAILAERTGELVAVAEAAVVEPDAWTGVVRFLETTLELQSGDRVLKELMVRYPPGEGCLGDARKELGRLLALLLERAHEQRAVRADFEVADLAILLWSFAPVIDATADVAPAAWRRHLHWVLDGLRPAAASGQVEPPLDETQLAEAMRSLREQRLQRGQQAPRRTKATS